MFIELEASPARGSADHEVIPNALLREWPKEVFELIKPHLRRVSFAGGDELVVPGQASNDVFFVGQGAIAAIWSKGALRFQAYLIGSEGCGGFTDWLTESPSCYQYRALVGGYLYKLEGAVLATALACSDRVSRSMSLYGAQVLNEIAETGAFTAAPARNRVARLVLSLIERTGVNQLTITQSEIASTLGLQRTTVCGVARELSKQGAMSYMRGKLKIKNREILEAYAVC